MERHIIKPSLRASIFERDEYRCVVCGKDGKEARLEIDHILPVSEGGTNSPTNLRLLCLECNRGRSGKRLQQQGVMKEFRRKARNDDNDGHITGDVDKFLEEILLGYSKEVEMLNNQLPCIFQKPRFFSKYGIGSLFRDPYKQLCKYDKDGNQTEGPVIMITTLRDKLHRYIRKRIGLFLWNISPWEHDGGEPWTML